MEIKKELFGLLGCNIGYSQSPQIFQKIWGDEPTPRDYRLVDTEEPQKFLDEVLSSEEWVGFSVTIPYKEWIIPYLHSITPIAQKVGAVNAVRVTPQGLIGHNTDVAGFLSAFDEYSLQDFIAPGNKALVLGTGGASKAVCYGLQSKGVEILTVSRNKERGDLTYNEITPQLIQEVTLIVNATPLGSKQFPHQVPEIPYHLLDARHLLYDLSYTPDSGFISHTPEQALCINGLPMLQAQAEAAYKFFTRGEY